MCNIITFDTFRHTSNFTHKSFITPAAKWAVQFFCLFVCLFSYTWRCKTFSMQSRGSFWFTALRSNRSTFELHMIPLRKEPRLLSSPGWFKGGTQAKEIYVILEREQEEECRHAVISNVSTLAQPRTWLKTGQSCLHQRTLFTSCSSWTQSRVQGYKKASREFESSWWTALTLSRDYGIYFIPSLCFKSWERPCDFFSLHKQVS